MNDGRVQQQSDDEAIAVESDESHSASFHRKRSPDAARHLCPAEPDERCDLLGPDASEPHFRCSDKGHERLRCLDEERDILKDFVRVRSAPFAG